MPTLDPFIDKAAKLACRYRLASVDTTKKEPDRRWSTKVDAPAPTSAIPSVDNAL